MWDRKAWPMHVHRVWIFRMSLAKIGISREIKEKRRTTAPRSELRMDMEEHYFSW